MNFVLEALPIFLDRIGQEKGQSEYVAFKGVETDIDEKCMCLGLKQNVLATPFYLTKLLYLQKINSKEDNRKEERSIAKDEGNIKNSSKNKEKIFQKT